MAPGPLEGEFRPPGDKSISHRALIISTLAEGESTIDGLLQAQDIFATAQACRQLGAQVTVDESGCRVNGVGVGGLSGTGDPLDMGNSGTAMRLLSGVLAAQSFDSIMIGDQSLSRRPMSRIARPLREMGAQIQTQDNGCPPLEIQGGQALRGIHYRSPVASAQVKSCVLLAGLYASGQTTVTEPAPSRDHTERMLRTFGAQMRDVTTIQGGSHLQAVKLEIPADISSAAFFIAAAALVPGSRVFIRDVGLNRTRAGLIDALERMGCDINISNLRNYGSEPVGNIEVRWRAGIRAIEIGGADIPPIIDELPVLMVVAACAEGVTRIRDAGELRVKESDRIAVMAAGLERLGFNVKTLSDGIDIEGRPTTDCRSSAGSVEESFQVTRIDAAGDHRCAMSFCVLAQVLQQPVQISGAAHIDTSYPGFVGDFSALGGAVQHQEEAQHV